MGDTDTARLTRRSAQEKSFFFLPGAQLAGRPAASVRRVTLSTTEHRQGSSHPQSLFLLPPTKMLSLMEMGMPSLACKERW